MTSSLITDPPPHKRYAVNSLLKGHRYKTDTSLRRAESGPVLKVSVLERVDCILTIKNIEILNLELRNVVSSRKRSC